MQNSFIHFEDQFKGFACWQYTQLMDGCDRELLDYSRTITSATVMIIDWCYSKYNDVAKIQL